MLVVGFERKSFFTVFDLHDDYLKGYLQIQNV